MENLGDATDRSDTAPVATSETVPPQDGEQPTPKLPAWRRALLRPDAWSVVIAATALLLSQLPPLLNFARGTSVELNMAPTAFITTHLIGLPQLSVHVGLENTGGRPSTVTRFGCNLVHVGTGREWALEVNSGQRASPNPGQQVEFYPLGWIPIRAGELWAGVVVCSSVTSDQDLQLIDQIRERFDRSIQEAFRSRIFQTQAPVRVSSDLSDEASRMFDERFELIEGEYELRIEAELANDNGAPTATGRFRLTPFSLSQLHRLKSNIEYGAGIVFPSTTGEAMVRLEPVNGES
jgi:hypothetical protein